MFKQERGLDYNIDREPNDAAICASPFGFPIDFTMQLFEFSFPMHLSLQHVQEVTPVYCCVEHDISVSSVDSPQV